MGLRLFGSHGYNNSEKRYYESQEELRFDLFEIVRIKSNGKFTLAKIHYKNATNYGCYKICLFKASYIDVATQKLLDPHFLEDKKKLSPIARFEPTKEGWNIGIKLMEQLND